MPDVDPLAFAIAFALTQKIGGATKKLIRSPPDDALDRLAATVAEHLRLCRWRQLPPGPPARGISPPAHANRSTAALGRPPFLNRGVGCSWPRPARADYGGLARRGPRACSAAVSTAMKDGRSDSRGLIVWLSIHALAIVVHRQASLDWSSRPGRMRRFGRSTRAESDGRDGAFGQ